MLVSPYVVPMNAQPRESLALVPSPPSTRRGLRLIMSSLAALVIAAGTLIPATAASAATGFVSPVSGHVADIVDGCPAGSRPSHEGVDINGNGGTPIYAAAAGTVATAINSSATSGYGTQVVITHADGYMTRYAHMVYGSIAVSQGATVAQGQRIGTVGSTGNSTGAHLHFEIKRNGSNVTNLYFYCGQPNVTALQPLGAGPSPTPVTDRSFSITTAGTLQGKTGMYEPVVNLRDNIKAMDADGTTVAAVDTSGNVWVQQGSFSNGWVGLMSGAVDVAIDGDRFVVLGADGTVWAKDGLYSTSWTNQLSGVTQIDAADGRIGVLKDNTLFVKEGNLWASWTNQGGGVTNFSLDGTRIGIISGGVAYVKEGNLWSSWVTMLAGSRIDLEGNRVAVLGGDGALVVKEGNLWEGWTTVTGPGLTDFSLSGNRIAVVSGGSVLIKTGPVNAGWVGAYGNSIRVDLA